MSGLIINNSQKPKLIENAILNTISFDTENSKKLRMDFGENIVGDFIIGEKLGEGTFSKVCVGSHRITQEKVAIKIMSKEQIKEPNDRLRIEKEINVQKKLHHSSIIQQYCIIETRSIIYIVTEYCSGGELFDYIVSKRRLNEAEACRLFQQLIAGLEYLHKQRIVHRDLKPENLLFNSKHELKIADFGLSNEYTGKLNTPCGSPCYAAPEMVTGKKYNGDLVDIWSSGVVLFTMVCGFLPFEDENQTGLFKKIAKGLYLIPTFVSAPCKDLIKSILITDPSKRFSFEMIKSHPWFTSSNNVMGKNIFFLSPGLFVNEDVIPIDENIVKKLVNDYKYDLKEIIQNVIMNKHNAITTSYYLILKKKIRNGEKSISDYSSYSELFIEYNKKSISKLTYFCNDFSLIIDYYYNRLKGLFQIKNAKDTIEVDEMQLMETTVPTENSPYEPVNTMSSYTSRYPNNNSNNNNTKKKFFLPAHFNKFINKKNSTNTNRKQLVMTKEQNSDSMKNSINNYIQTEPSQTLELEHKLKFHTIEEMKKRNGEINKMCNEQNLKKITDKIASIILKKSTIQHDISNKTIDNDNEISSNNNHIINTNTKDNQNINNENSQSNNDDFFGINEPSTRKIQTERRDYQCINQFNQQFINKQKDILTIPIENPPIKTQRQKCINTSMISVDSRSNSPIPIEAYFKKKIDLIKASKYKSNKEALKLLYHNNKQTHYSQNQTNMNDIEIACPKTNGHSFIESHNHSNTKRIKPYVSLKTNRYNYHHHNYNNHNQLLLTNRLEPQTKRTLSTSSHRKPNLSPMLTGRTEKNRLVKYKPNITNINKLNKYVNVNCNNNMHFNDNGSRHSNNTTAYKTIQKKNKSFDDQQPKSTRSPFPKLNNSKPIQRPIYNFQNKDNNKNVVRTHNQSIFNAYCKKALKEIKDIIISVIGKNVVINNASKGNKIEFNCKYYLKNQLFHFILTITKVPDAQEYHLITPSLITGNMVTFKYIFDRIKTKLSGF